MENASKALIIAGAILLSILIIAIGMYVYNSAQSTINDSLTSMSDSEKNAFNSKFTGYATKQTGSQVKSLIGDLITNSNTFIEEPAKIINFRIDQVNASNSVTNTEAPRPAQANATDSYVQELGIIRNGLENKHTYWVELVYNAGGVIDTINVSYDPANQSNTGTMLGGGAGGNTP